jgi:hypothetical protein
MSPLLRLPGEIRNRTWALAMGGNYVKAMVQRDFDGKTTMRFWGVGYDQVSIGDQTRQAAAFHLPEVCRKVYSETATLAYKLNTFFIGFDWFEVGVFLLAAQKKSVTIVMPAPVFLKCYIKGTCHGALKEMFPNLKRIEVSRTVLVFRRDFYWLFR